MNHVSDVLTATFTRSNTDLRMLGETMTYAGPLPHSSVSVWKVWPRWPVQWPITGSAVQWQVRHCVPVYPALLPLSAKVRRQWSSSAYRSRILTANYGMRGYPERCRQGAEAIRPASQIRIKRRYSARKQWSAWVPLSTLPGTAVMTNSKANENSGGEADKNAKVKIDNLTGDLKQLQSAGKTSAFRCRKALIPRCAIWHKALPM